MKLKPMVCLLTITFVCATIQKVEGQKNFDAAIGLGVHAMAHIAFRYQIHQVKVGVNVGTFPEKSTKSIAYSGDIYYHFGGNSKYTSIRPWFFRGGVTFGKSENDLSTTRDQWVYLRAGRDFNVSSKLGFSIDIGLSKRTGFKQEYKRPYSSYLSLDFTESPSGSFQVFYRL